MQNNDFDVCAIRGRLGLSTEALAAELYVTEREVLAWESGRLPVPRRMRRMLEFLDAAAEWDAGMEASGLPACAWMSSIVLKAARAGRQEQLIALTKQVVAHTAACDVCRARRAWADEHLPEQPQPPATGLERLFQLVGRLPGWAHPAAYGAIALFLITGVRALFFVPAVTREPLQLLKVLGVALLAAAAGAVGGFGYSLTRPALRRLGWPGDYVSGIVAVMTYMGAIAVAAALSGEPMITDMPGLVIFAFVSVLFGVLVGKMIQELQSTTPA